MNAENEILASLLETNMRHERALFEQGLKIQAMELTLRSFPETKPKYEQSLAALRTPLLVQEFESSERLALAAIEQLRKESPPTSH